MLTLIAKDFIDTGDTRINRIGLVPSSECSDSSERVDNHK